MNPFSREGASLGIALAVACATAALGQEHTLWSPDKRIEVRVTVGATIDFAVRYQGRELLAPSVISMALEGGTVLGRAASVVDARRRSQDQELKPVVRQKAAVIRDRFNELQFTFKGDYGLVFRAYDDGMAYRFLTTFPAPITVLSEQTEFTFAKDHPLYFPEEESFHSHQERIYRTLSISQVTAKRFCSVPALVDMQGGPKIAITEADLEDYAGMYLTGSEFRDRRRL